MPVYAKARGKWRVRIYNAKLPGGRKDWVVEGRKAEAEAFEARKRVELERASEPQEYRTVPTFAAFCSETYKKHAKLHLKASTWERKKSHLVSLAMHLGSRRLTEIDAAAVEEYARRRKADGLKPVSINNEIRALKRVLNFARERGINVPAPRWRYLPERGGRKAVAWSDQEAARLLEVTAKVSPAILPLVVFLLNTGARKGEALALRWEDVDEKRRLIRIWPNAEWQPKNDEPREVPIGDALLPWLKEPKGDDAPIWVFPTPKGRRYATWPRRAWERAHRAANVGGTLHSTRHTFASHFLAQVPDLYLLAQVMGHSDATVTRLYAHLLPGHLARARNAVSFASPVGAAELAAAARWKGGCS